ncbi:MAG: PAS domain S-box protein [Bradyrhizobium sp.]
MGELRSTAKIDDEDFLHVLNSLPTLCWIADVHGSIFWYNRRWNEYTGISAEVLHGWGWTKVHDPDRLPEVLKGWKHSIETGQPFEMTFPLRGHDGIFRPFLTRVVPVTDATGSIIRWLGTNVDVSAQLAAEEALRKSEELYRSALAAGRLGTWQTDLIAKTRLWTPEGMALFGLNISDGCGRVGGDDDEYRSALHPSDRHLMHKFHELVETQDSITSEYRVVWPDGTIHWLRGHGYVVARLPDGKAHRMVSIVADVTDRKAAEDKLARAQGHLKESEERFRLVAENAPVMIWMGDAQGKCVYLNRAQREFWNVNSEELFQFDWSKTLIAEDTEKLFGPFSEAMLAQAPFIVEARYRRHDGQIRLLQTNARPRFGSNGEFLGMIGVNLDITDSRRSEAALREETAALEILNRTGSAVAAELDLEKLVQHVTDAGVRLTGAQFGAFFYNVLDERGESLMLYTLSGASREAFAEYPMPRATKIFAPTFRGDGIVRSPDILLDDRYGHNLPHHGMPQGHLSVRSYLAVPVRSRTGEVLGGLFFGHPEPNVFTERSERLSSGLAAQAAVGIDNARLFQSAQQEIQQRRGAEDALLKLNSTLEQQVAERTEQLRKQEEALRQAQKMEAVGQLTGGVAHDFNNLLQVIVGNLEILQRNLPTGAERLRRAAENAMKGAKRASTLTESLLAFSRRQPLNPKPIKVNDLVRGMSELFYRALGEQIAIETVLAAGLWQTEADPNQLEAALLNLAVNARDAMPSGGKLTIETANAHIDDGYAATQTEVIPGQYVVICVSDNGVGMDKSTLGQVFEPFFTTKEPGKGTGLGLSQVYGFVKQSGGHVKLYSEPEQGTTVKIYLPRLLMEDQSVDHASTQTIAPEGTTEETILVLEDDDDVRTYSVDILRELGYRVIEAHDGPSALRLLERQTRVDLLFTDVVLPSGLTGADVAAEVRKLRPEIRVLFTTGYARNAIVHQGRLDAGISLIPKPFTYAQLAAKVRDVLDSRT